VPLCMGCVACGIPRVGVLHHYTMSSISIIDPIGIANADVLPGAAACDVVSLPYSVVPSLSCQRTVPYMYVRTTRDLISVYHPV
jgi:hypothetical protein